MQLSDCVDTWFSENAPKISSLKRVRYELKSWISRGGSPIVEEIDTPAVKRWRLLAADLSLSPRTIESVIATVLLLCRVGGNTVAAGKRLQRNVSIRHTPTLADLDAVLAVADSAKWRSGNWWRSALCLAYCTGLRLGDLERFTRDTMHDDCIRVVAGKTGKPHHIPLPQTLLPRVAGFRWRIGRKVLRREIAFLCDVAKIEHFTPQGIRRLAANEWERARQGCGPIILGHDIPGWNRSTPHYLDKSLPLRLGLPALRLPAWIDDGRSQDRETALMSSFRRMPEPQQTALVAVASGMSGS